MSKLSLASLFPDASEQDWREAVETALKGAPFDQLTSQTFDAIKIEPLYTACHDAVAPLRRDRTPGSMAWDVIQRCDAPDIARANKQIHTDLKGGASGLAIILPGTATAGQHGVPITKQEDLERLLEGVELDLINLRLNAGTHAQHIAPMLIDLYRQRNLQLERCNVNFGLDPSSEFALTGMIVRRDLLVERIRAVVHRAMDSGHCGPVLVADSRVFHGAGSSYGQELGFIAAGLADNLRLLEATGVTLEDAASRVGVVMAASQEQFFVLSKMRAVRIIWQRMCEVMNIDAPAIRIDVETSLRMMTRRDIYVNMLRATSSALAAGIGGADSVTVLPFSFALGLPDEFARRMALNVQNILLEESGIGQTCDAAAGSGCIETLTGQLAATGWEYFQTIEAEGGMYDALASGSVHSAISDMASCKRQMIAQRGIKITGVSEFASLDETEIKLWDIKIPDDWLAHSRNTIQAEDDDIITCSRLPQERTAKDFETLREAADDYNAEHGSLPCIYFTKLGAAADYTERATWAQNLFATGGLETRGDEAATSEDEIITDFKSTNCSQACICASDQVYSQSGEAVARALKKAGATYVWLVGKPGDNEKRLRAAGVDGFVHAGVNAVSILQSVHALSGVETRRIKIVKMTDV